ncbi:MAG TPA: glycosyltransferase family 4 protein [Vulgatibacter sp.]|nr:glycosyltransferase family 4 protein [Vulgatibacter sp.]
MRILYLHQYFKTPSMSGGTRSFELARRLVEHGHDVHIVASDQESNSRSIRRTKESGILVTWIPVRYSNQLAFNKRLLAFAKFAIQSSFQAMRWNPDVVYATSTPLTIGIPGLLASRRWGVPLVFEVRDLWPEIPIAMGALRNPFTRAAARYLERTIYQNSAHVVALSPGMRDGILAAGVEAERTSVIPNLCNPDFSLIDERQIETLKRGLPPLSGRKVVVYAGTFGKANDLSYLILLARKCLELDPSILFLVAGDGMEREEIVSLAHREGVLNSTVYFLGRLPKAQMPSFFQLADVSLALFAPIPELEHNSANKFFDSIATGCPVAINYGGWQADLIRKESLGIVLDRDVARASRLLVDSLKDRPFLDAARASALRLRHEFSADKAAASLMHILENVRGTQEATAAFAGLPS